MRKIFLVFARVVIGAIASCGTPLVDAVRERKAAGCGGDTGSYPDGWQGTAKVLWTRRNRYPGEIIAILIASKDLASVSGDLSRLTEILRFAQIGCF